MQLFARQTKLFARQTELFARQTELFAWQTELFARQTELFARQTELFAQKMLFDAWQTQLVARQMQMQLVARYVTLEGEFGLLNQDFIINQLTQVRCSAIVETLVFLIF